MFQTKSVYLCGPISGFTYKGCNDWREYVKRELERDVVRYSIETYHGDLTVRDNALVVPKFKCINPMRGEEPFLSSFEGELLASHEDISPEHPLAKDHVQNARDMWDVGEADVLFANFTGAKIGSMGTAGEMAVGWWLHKFVLMIAEPENLHAKHGLLREWASLILPTVDDGIAYLKEVLYK